MMAALSDLTFDMSGSRRQAQPAGGCPLDGGARPHVAGSLCARYVELKNQTLEMPCSDTS